MIGLQHLGDMFLVHDVLRLARIELLAGVDEENVFARLIHAALLAGAVKYEDGDRNTRAGEQVGRKADDCVEKSASWAIR